MRKAIKLLRDIYEHWNEYRQAFREMHFGEKDRSGKEFVTMFPSGKPWSIIYGVPTDLY